MQQCAESVRLQTSGHRRRRGPQVGGHRWCGRMAFDGLSTQGLGGWCLRTLWDAAAEFVRCEGFRMGGEGKEVPAGAFVVWAWVRQAPSPFGDPRFLLLLGANGVKRLAGAVVAKVPGRMCGQVVGWESAPALFSAHDVSGGSPSRRRRTGSSCGKFWRSQWSIGPAAEAAPAPVIWGTSTKEGIWKVGGVLRWFFSSQDGNRAGWPRGGAL